MEETIINKDSLQNKTAPKYLTSFSLIFNLSKHAFIEQLRITSEVCVESLELSPHCVSHFPLILIFLSVTPPAPTAAHGPLGGRTHSGSLTV